MSDVVEQTNGSSPEANPNRYGFYGRAPEVPWNKVEWRVQGGIDSQGGCTAVAYVDQVTVGELLDEWCGPFNWRDSYETVKAGTLWGHLEVYNPAREEWVRKTDIGTASSMEPDKGLVSDAFKRVATRKWGIARNIYSIPTVHLDRGQFRTYKNRKGEEMPALNKKSAEVILRRMRTLGLTEVAEKTKVNTDEAGQPAEAASAEPGSANRPVADVVNPAVTSTPRSDPGPDAYPGDDLNRKGADSNHRALVAEIAGRADQLVAAGAMTADKRTQAIGHAGKSVQHAEAVSARLTQLETETAANATATDGADSDEKFHRWEMANLSGAGVDEQMRHDLARIVSIGRTEATGELSREERRQRVKVAQRIKAGKVKPAYGPEGALTIVDPGTGERIDPWRLP